MPTTTDPMMPSARRPRLGSTSSVNRSPNHVVKNVVISSPGVGTKKLGLTMADSHHSAMSTTGSARRKKTDLKNFIPRPPSEPTCATRACDAPRSARRG